MTFQAVQNHLIDCWDRFPFLYQIPRFYKQAIIHIEAICKLIRCYSGDLWQIVLYTVSSRVNTLKQTTTRNFSKSGNVQVVMTMTIGFGVQTLDHVTSSSEITSQFNKFLFPPNYSPYP